MVTDGYGKGIRRIVQDGDRGEREQALQHLPYLILSGAAIPGDGLFYPRRGIFCYRDTGLDGGGDGHPLRAAQFEHALYVLSEERGFDGEFMGAIPRDELAN